jgi:hypothetical protein
VPTGVKQADRDAARADDAAGAICVHPDALGTAVHADFAKQPWRKPAGTAGRQEAGPHRFATLAFLCNMAAGLNNL